MSRRPGRYTNASSSRATGDKGVKEYYCTLWVHVTDTHPTRRHSGGCKLGCLLTDNMLSVSGPIKEFPCNNCTHIPLSTGATVGPVRTRDRENVSESARCSGRFGFYLFAYTGTSLLTHVGTSLPSHRPFAIWPPHVSRFFAHPPTHPFGYLSLLALFRPSFVNFSKFYSLSHLISSPCLLLYYKILVHGTCTL